MTPLVAVVAAVGAVSAASPASAVTGGSEAFSGDLSLVPAVMRVDASDPTYYCSGTLIAPQWVLTAQHCTNKNGSQGNPYSPDKVVVKVNKSSTSKARSIRAAEIWRMDGYDERTLVNDLALLKLSSPIPDVKPVGIAGRPIPVGTNGYSYGFGPTNSSGFWKTVKDRLTFSSGNGPTTMPRLAELKVASPSAACALPAPLTYATSVRGFPVHGDSGGPMLEWNNGVPTIFDVFAGDLDRTTCQGGRTDRPGDWVGMLNRVDRLSSGWRFITTYVPELRATG